MNWKEINKFQLLQHFKEGLWYEEISKLYGISSRAVRTKTKKFGIILERKNKSKKEKVEDKICKRCGKLYKVSSNEGYCSLGCKNIVNDTLTKIEIPLNINLLGKSILEERNLGFSFSEIAKKLNCSKSTVSYYCNNTTKDRIKKRTALYKLENPGMFSFSKRVSNFKRRTKGVGKLKYCKDWNKKLRTAVSFFKKSNGMSIKNKYNYKDALKHLGGVETKCYLTGKNINIENDDYCLDHIIPLDRGGNNELENMGITTPEANASKTNLTLEEYLDLCRLVLENFNFTIQKPARI